MNEVKGLRCTVRKMQSQVYGLDRKIEPYQHQSGNTIGHIRGQMEVFIYALIVMKELVANVGPSCSGIEIKFPEEGSLTCRKEVRI